MKITESANYNGILNNISEFLKRKKVFTGILLLGLYSSMLFISGIVVHRTGIIYKLRKSISPETLKIPYNYVIGQIARPEQIIIDIKYEDFQKLSYWRDLALKNYTLHSVDHDYVNAEIRYKEDTIPAKIRLRGSTANEHLAGDKWSLRVKIRGEKTLFGMKDFSLMDPKRRNFMLEWLFRRVMRKEGVISKRYGFIEVIINGRKKGVYAIDEHFGKTMIEANQRREAPIIRLLDDSIWLERAAFQQHPSQWGDYYYSAYIGAIGLEKIMNDEFLSKQLREARNLFEAFRKGDLRTHEVFDVDKLAKWMAAGDILGAWHGFVIFNMKFYYNPITSRLEPIPDDAYTELSFRSGIFRLNDQFIAGAFLKQIFSDLIFTEKYIQELEHFSKRIYLDNIINDLSEEIAENLRILHRDYPAYKFPKYQLYMNQESIREVLNPHRGILVYFKEECPKNIILSIASVKALPIEILNVTYKGNTVLEPKHGRTILRGKEYAKPLVYSEIEFSFPEGFDGIESISDLNVSYKILGTNRKRDEPVFPLPCYDPSFIDRDTPRQQPNYQDFPFLRLESSTKQIHLERGDWVLSQNLIIPEGYTFICGAGTNLDLRDSAIILSYSPIIFIGSEEYPITVSSSDSTGQGIVVLTSDRKSFLENAIFKNLSAASKGGWQLTGAVTFYESPVSISQCRFLENRSEDGLNIIRSKFKVQNSLFKDNLSDGLDSDFSDGYVSGTSFLNCGNDAIDCSGSDVDVCDCYINGMGDKGLSGGENSQLTVNHIEIKNSRIAVASKDRSIVNIKGVNMCGCNVAFAVYQKKSEYGPSTMMASSIKLVDVVTPYLVEEGSILLVDNQKIDAFNKDVYRRLYGDE